MPFAFKVGVFGLVKDNAKYSETEKKQLLDAWKKSALRAEEDFARYEALFRCYLASEINGSALVNEAAGAFFKSNPSSRSHSRSLWNQIMDALMLSPNFGGVGVDLKKLCE